jgi:hypothetical protein
MSPKDEPSDARNVRGRPDDVEQDRGRWRRYRDLKPLAIEAAEFLKRKHPHAAVVVKDLQSGETKAVEYKPASGPRGRDTEASSASGACSLFYGPDP